MAKSIQLKAGNAPAPKNNPTQGMPVPPPAAAPPGIKGQLPLPVGRVVTQATKIHLTDLERKTLMSVGWQEGQPIPSNMANIIAEAEAAARQDAAAAANRIPVSPDTPPVDFKPVDINTLSPQQQAEVQRKIDEAVQQEAAAAVAARQGTGAAVPLTISKSVDVPVEPLKNPPAGYKIEPGYQRPRPQPAEQPKEPEPAAAPAAGSEEPEFEAVGRLKTECPHCGWDLGMDDIPEPDYAEKLKFATAFIGRINYTRTYTILGGGLQVSFRTLTGREIDACYRQTFSERESGKITTAVDFLERVNRFRVYLQLYRLGSSELPDGLSLKDNPNATGVWETDSESDKAPLLQIEEHILGNVLTNESLLRVVNQLCIGFNRLVARLEAMVEKSDFWKPTDSQS